MNDLAFSLPALINIAIGAVFGVAVSLPVSICFQRRAADRLDTATEALASFLEHHNASTRAGNDLGLRFTRDSSGRLTGGTTVSIKGNG